MTFRSRYDYEIEYEYDFLNWVLLLSIITVHTNNLAPFQPFRKSEERCRGSESVNGIKFENPTRTPKKSTDFRHLTLYVCGLVDFFLILGKRTGAEAL